MWAEKYTSEKRVLEHAHVTFLPFVREALGGTNSPFPLGD